VPEGCPGCEVGGGAVAAVLASIAATSDGDIGGDAARRVPPDLGVEALLGAADPDGPGPTDGPSGSKTCLGGS
jgi:hypothetical protein